MAAPQRSIIEICDHRVAAVWLALIIFNTWFDRWVVLAGSGAASSGHFRPILGGPGGPGRNSNIYVFDSCRTAATIGHSRKRVKPAETKSVTTIGPAGTKRPEIGPEIVGFWGV